ncbi:MAG: tail fiber domain-containing protein [Candidatus Binatia bacterium]
MGTKAVVAASLLAIAVVCQPRLVAAQCPSSCTVSGSTALGTGALSSNTQTHNTGVGFNALQTNTNGEGNTAVGFEALQSVNGNNNTAVGTEALQKLTAGGGNIAIGTSNGTVVPAGFNYTGAESNNIDIGSGGVLGESNKIHIGTPGTHNAIYLAGIGAGVGNVVQVTSQGQLTFQGSSARFKEDIQDMGDATRGLLKLRPVRFHYKKDIDPSGVAQYGLVAEEVAKVYPDLVAYDEQGRPLAVRYQSLAPMLLNELQKQQRQIGAQRQQLSEQAHRIAQLAEQSRQLAEQARHIDALTARLTQLEAVLAAQGHAPAQEAAYQISGVPSPR